ncbi:efflux RND transporter periplasmic adaptor subunit, partial [Pseudodesulfovibrio sp.]|uniref:efflux RND transporter periplasmic adaptor subunit n=1 Tax=Pseudodesulfovibrio sp. TaxID=2035812 RepID=UPI0026232BC0
MVSLSCVLLSGCSDKEKKQAQAEPQGPKPVKVVKVETRDMPYWAELIGTISAVETVDVRARVAGFLLKKNFKEGARVKKGDLLFVIDPKPFNEDLKQAQSGLEYNQALVEKARKDFIRFKKLYEENVVSRDEYESYQTQLATYEAQVRDNAAKVENAKIQLGYTSIYSPLDGDIGRVQVDVGNLVGQGENTLLATVSSVDPVYVSFSVTEADYLRARRSRKVDHAEESELKLILADGDEYDHNGVFDMVDRAVDPRTGTLGVRVKFPNPEGLLRPGQYAKVRLLVENVKNAMVVPVRAVMDTQGMKSIFKVEEDGKVVNQPLTLGFERNSLVVIREGLKPGDMI